MSGHTPEWKLETASRHDDINPTLCHRISGKNWAGFALVVTRLDGDDFDHPEGIANARLIAAAPELLAALERIASLDPAQDSDEGHNEWGEADCFRKAQDAARAAIAKATTP
jgi:hypothetical protein